MPQSDDPIRAALNTVIGDIDKSQTIFGVFACPDKEVRLLQDSVRRIEARRDELVGCLVRDERSKGAVNA